MIEKIPFETEKITYKGKTMEIDTHASPYDLQHKINELVDAVNELQEFCDVADKNLAKLMEESTRAENVQPDAESRPENVQDKFAEQRKWIGKICKFWDIDNDYLYYGPLTKISDTGPYYYECNHRICYVHCEPVKDDVIYKGDNNE